MKPFATLLALGLVCGAAASNVTCVKTPAEFVANLETINYQKLNRPNVAAAGSAAAPPDNASMAYDLKYLLSVDQRLQRLETTGTFEGTWVDSRLAFDPSSACAGVDHFHLPTATVQEKLWIPRAYIKNEVLTDVSSYRGADTFSIRSDGRVLYTTMRRITSKCAMDFKRMPYDKQKCDIVVAVRDDPSEVKLVPLPADLQSQFNLPAGNPEWDLKSLTRNYKDNTDTIVAKLNRKSKYARGVLVCQRSDFRATQVLAPLHHHPVDSLRADRLLKLLHQPGGGPGTRRRHRCVLPRDHQLQQ